MIYFRRAAPIATERDKMTTPLWALLGFAIWTLIVLIVGIGAYRFSQVFSGKAKPADFPGGVAEGAPYYCRATRAHANCLENLPVFAALVLIAAVSQIDMPRLDQLAVAVLVARIVQSLIHLCLPVSNNTVKIRGLFFLVQIVAFLWMAVLIALAA